MSDFETIELLLDETNSLLFKVSVQGASQNAETRIIFDDGPVSYMFLGIPEGGDNVTFQVPPMQGKLNADVQYPSRLEVLVDHKFFSPVQFLATFKRGVEVSATNLSKAKDHPGHVSVTAELKKEATVTATPQRTMRRPKKTGAQIAQDAVRKLLGRG